MRNILLYYVGGGPMLLSRTHIGFRSSGCAATCGVCTHVCVCFSRLKIDTLLVPHNIIIPSLPMVIIIFYDVVIGVRNTKNCPRVVHRSKVFQIKEKEDATTHTHGGKPEKNPHLQPSLKMSETFLKKMVEYINLTAVLS